MGDDASQRSLGEELRQLRAIVEELVARAGRQQQIGEILAAADQQPSFSQRKPKRDRHGLHIVRGLAPLGAVGAWLGRSRPRRVTAAVAAMTLATGATLTPDVMAPASQVPRHHHARVEHRHRPDVPEAVPVMVPPRRKRRRVDNDATVSRRASPSPSPSAPPSPSPEPSPLPSVTVPPVPTPLPTCTLAPHRKHCHGGDEVVTVQWVLRFRSALAWDDMPAGRSVP